MKNLLLLISLFYFSRVISQNYYSFSRATGSYNKLTGATTVINGKWDDFESAVKLPFAFKLFNQSFTDSFYIDDFGSISFDNTYNEELSFFGDDLNSRGNNISEVSYKVEGTSPDRIFKLQFDNAGLFADNPLFMDSINLQLWLYETSNIIEIRFGDGKVSQANWSDNGPFIGLVNPVNFNNYIIIEKNTINPTVNTTNIANSSSLDGLPATGTIYRFTPSQFQNGIQSTRVSFNIDQYKISVPADLQINEIMVVNTLGQIIQSAHTLENIDLSVLPMGIYIVYLNTGQGTISKKIML